MQFSIVFTPMIFQGVYAIFLIVNSHLHTYLTQVLIENGILDILYCQNRYAN